MTVTTNRHDLYYVRNMLAPRPAVPDNNVGLLSCHRTAADAFAAAKIAAREFRSVEVQQVVPQDHGLEFVTLLQYCNGTAGVPEVYR